MVCVNEHDEAAARMAGIASIHIHHLVYSDSPRSHLRLASESSRGSGKARAPSAFAFQA
jgi:hypothetical protein